MSPLDWSQVFSFMHKITGWHTVVTDVGYLQTRSGDSEADMQWNLLVRHDITMDEFQYQIMAGLKLLSNKTLAPDFNSAVFSLLDNRPTIAGK